MGFWGTCKIIFPEGGDSEWPFSTVGGDSEYPFSSEGGDSECPFSTEGGESVTMLRFIRVPGSKDSRVVHLCQ